MPKRKSSSCTDSSSRRGFSTVSRYASLNSSSVGPEYSPPVSIAFTVLSMSENV